MRTPPLCQPFFFFFFFAFAMHGLPASKGGALPFCACVKRKARMVRGANQAAFRVDGKRSEQASAAFTGWRWSGVLCAFLGVGMARALCCSLRMDMCSPSRTCVNIEGIFKSCRLVPVAEYGLQKSLVL
jgi:hypothetical protein